MTLWIVYFPKSHICLLFSQDLPKQWQTDKPPYLYSIGRFAIHKLNHNNENKNKNAIHWIFYISRRSVLDHVDVQKLTWELGFRMLFIYIRK